MNNENSFKNVINLGNSIIGVSILAMPYCFQKCGIALSLLLIIGSGLLTRATCHLLLKAAIMERRRNFEFLAFHTFGTMGKFAVEFGIIGFLLGSCIAFFVVIGDLSPPLVSELFLVENNSRLRVEVLLFLGFFVGLPLGLLRKVESLTSFSALSVCFYIFLIFKILIEALPNISYEKIIYELNWWRPAGLLSSLPIFSMALSCQTQLFEIFDTLSDPSLKRMDSVVTNAVHLCSSVYSMVGLFGYIAFFDQSISGNILMKLPTTGLTKIVKFAFVLTVVVSFPLCLFPCRSSLHSLLFKSGVSFHDLPGNLIPDHRFRCLTFTLVAITISTAIMLPNIEFVLGILGSTIGTIICFILPALVFIRNTAKNTNERLLAQGVFGIGFFILVACSYSTLRDSASSDPSTFEIQNQITKGPVIVEKPILPIHLDLPEIIPLKDDKLPEIIQEVAKGKKELEKPKGNFVAEKNSIEEEKRQEPPIPQAPDEVNEKPKEVVEGAVKTLEKKMEVPLKIDPLLVETKKESVAEEKENPGALLPVKEAADENILDADALKKEDKELSNNKKGGRVAQADRAAALAERPAQALAEQMEKINRKRAELEEDASKKQDELLRKIEIQQQQQKILLDEQRKLLEELKEHKETHRKQEEMEKGEKKEEQEEKIVPKEEQSPGKEEKLEKVVPEEKKALKVPDFLPQVETVKKNAPSKSETEKKFVLKVPEVLKIENKVLKPAVEIPEKKAIVAHVQAESAAIVSSEKQVEPDKVIKQPPGLVASSNIPQEVPPQRIEEPKFEKKIKDKEELPLEKLEKETSNRRIEPLSVIEDGLKEIILEGVNKRSVGEKAFSLEPKNDPAALGIVDYKNEIRRLLQVTNLTNATVHLML